MRIVILDGICVNGGDISWEGFHKLGEVTLYARTAYGDIAARAENAEIIITNKCTLDEKVLSKLPCVKYIGVLATGYNNIDLKYAAANGITVTNIPSYSTPSVAQTVFALILQLAYRMDEHNRFVHEGKWCECPDFCYYDKRIFELQGKTIGIVGFGKIGEGVAKIAKAMDMNVLVYNKQRKIVSPFADEQSYTTEELAEKSDVITLCCPLTAENHGFVNAEFLSKMKRTAILINTSRGALINESDLAECLQNDRIAGAGLDVLATEPPNEDNALLNCKNAFITPHIAWASREARTRLVDIAVSNLKSFLNGVPVNKIN